MGGLIATNLARKGLVDLLVADRTFGQLEAVVDHGMFGPHVAKLMKLLTLWNETESSSDYVLASCYKVIG